MKKLLFNLVWAAAGMLAFLLIFEQRIAVPAYLQVAGRLHPALLHFPIALNVLYLLWVLRRPGDQENGKTLLLLTAASSVFTALAGLLLSRESGYDAESIAAHKWSGAALAFFNLLWYVFYDKIRTRQQMLLAVLAGGITLLTGHWGGEITHGKDYLSAPLAPTTVNAAPTADFEAMEVFAHLVEPILRQKCYSCHNEQKAKGGLVMSNREALQKGGKNGPLWQPQSGKSLLLDRLHLPLEHKEHMPPAGKPQLSEVEKSILRRWIQGGAAFDQKVASLPENDSLRILVQGSLQQQTMEQFHFPAASEQLVRQLNTQNLVVRQQAVGSPALQADFYGAQLFQAGQLQALLKAKQQLVGLNLNKMPLRDADLPVVAQFTELRQLNLAFTQISSAGLAALAPLKALRKLSLSGTAVDVGMLPALQQLPALKQVQVWNTALTAADIAALKGQLPGIQFEPGYQNDTVLLRLPAPQVLNENQFLREPELLRIKNFVSGASVRYSLDGSEPDSLQSPLYTPELKISKGGPVKLKAFKAGWASSAVTEAYFFSAHQQPDSIWNLLPPEPDYRHVKARKLLDLKRGDKDNFRSGEWQAYRYGPMETMMQFNTPMPLSGITISYLLGIGSYIMPPQSVEVWGGEQPGNLRLLGKLTPQQPEQVKPNANAALELKFAQTSVRYVKIKANPVAKLPKWHPGKGDVGWFFVDEVVVF